MMEWSGERRCSRGVQNHIISNVNQKVENICDSQARRATYVSLVGRMRSSVVRMIWGNTTFGEKEKTSRLAMEKTTHLAREENATFGDRKEHASFGERIECATFGGRK